jgi:predicted TIM-barrel fold metal-dependent hydrolase
MTATLPNIDSPAVADGRYVIVSVDGHAGASLMQYRDYLPSRLHGTFDEWVGMFENPFEDIAGETGYRNWDSTRRLKELEEDGVVAEVLFPNTIPPFYPSGNLTAAPPKAGEHELRWEGLKAHNRWMADFCNDTPGRRAGLVQILMHDVDAAVKEIEWGKEAGLFGGVLLPGIPPDSGLEPMISPTYEPIWRVCSELDMPINHHSANAGPSYGPYPATGWMFFVEAGFFSHRALWMLIFAGVFDRYPNLKLILTEGGAEWAPGVMKILDHNYNRLLGKGMGPWAAMRKAQAEAAEGKGGDKNPHERTIANAFGGMQMIEKLPTEYFKQNVWIGSSFTSPREAAVRHEIGVGRIMWGNDYPHHEATYPFTREALRFTFSDTPPEELALMLGGNAFEVYDFDIEQLRQVAVAINAPTVGEIQVPLEAIPEDATSQCFEDAPNRIW